MTSSAANSLTTKARVTNVSDSATRYRVADLTLDVLRRSVARGGQPVELKALDFDLLRFLVESAPNVVNTDVLAEQVWGRHFVSPENVAQRVMLLRQSLGDDATQPHYIETVRNKGYRLIPVVEKLPAAQPDASSRSRRLVAAAATLLLVSGVAAAAVYWLSGPADRAPPLPSSVAVLPFENLSPEPDEAYFAAGMQDEIVGQLLKISGLRVFRVRSADQDIVHGLNVAAVLSGNVHYADDRLRVNTYLTEVGSDEVLWSDSYEREQSAIFAIQSGIALEVAHALSVELSAPERERIERVPTTDPLAHDLYLMALARQERGTRTELLSAIDEVERALALDDRFVEAWVLNATFHVTAQSLDPDNLIEHRKRAKAAANRALDLDSELARAHAALGFVLSSERDWRGAEAAFRKATSLNLPTSGFTGAYATLQLSAGHFARARELLEQARAAEPEDLFWHRFLAFSHAALGDWEKARSLYESSTRLFGGDASAAGSFERIPGDQIHWLIGRNELAQARAIATADTLHVAMLASLDRPEEALAALRQTYAATGAGNARLRNNIGVWAGHFGDPMLALDAMRAAIDEVGSQAVFLWYPQLAPMRRLPEFKAYMRDIGMVEYWEEYGWPPLCRPLDGLDFECD